MGFRIVRGWLRSLLRTCDVAGGMSKTPAPQVASAIVLTACNDFRQNFRSGEQRHSEGRARTRKLSFTKKKFHGVGEAWCFLDISILVCTTLALAFFLLAGNQHQGTRVTSSTVAVPEVTWFPDVVFAKAAFCFVFVQVSLFLVYCRNLQNHTPL